MTRYYQPIDNSKVKSQAVHVSHREHFLIGDVVPHAQYKTYIAAASPSIFQNLFDNVALMPIPRNDYRAV